MPWDNYNVKKYMHVVLIILHMEGGLVYTFTYPHIMKILL